MTCDECLRVMEDDLDAQSDGQSSDLLASHLAACSSCAKEQQALQREREIYAQYSREVEVTPALWTAVRTRIEGDSKSPEFNRWRSFRQWVAGMTAIPGFTPVLTASLILVALGMTAVLIRVINSRPHEAKDGVGLQEAKKGVERSSQPAIPPPNPVEKGAEGQAQQRASQHVLTRQKRQQLESSSRGEKKTVVTPRGRQALTVEELVAQAEQKYLAAIAILSRDVKKRGSTLDPELRARFEETLVVIDRTIADTRQAVGRRPTDPEAVRYMLTAYAKKVEVLQELASY
jgi:hypothetical protein